MALSDGTQRCNWPLVFPATLCTRAKIPTMNTTVLKRHKPGGTAILKYVEDRLHAGRLPAGKIYLKLPACRTGVIEVFQCSTTLVSVTTSQKY